MDYDGLPYPGLDTNNGIGIKILDWVVFWFTVIFVIIRLGTRLWITCNFGWDDAFMALALV